MTPLLCAVMLFVPSAPAVAQGGPPPEIRELVQAVVDAVNGDAAGFESFAQARFTPGLLQKQTPGQRAELHRRLADDFGAIGLEGVRRRGPDAPLDLMVKGAKARGVISVELAAGSPPKIAGLRVELGDADPGDGVPRPPVDGSLTAEEIDKRLDGYFTTLAADEVFSGVTLVARSGVPVFFKAYGLADRDKKAPNTVRTRFNIGSINKAFTQIAIRQLVAAGKLAPTDTLGKFFPDYPQAVSRGATVEQLLTHRAGLADFFGPEFSRAPKDRFASNADYFRFVGSLPPTFAPGERNQYCNGCYIALGAIVEHLSGMPYEKYVAENVFARAEMTSTGYPRSDRREADMAIGYTRRGGDSLRNNGAMHGVTGSAAGGGYSTALDLLAYVKAVGAGRFPGTEPDMGIAGGAPGTSAVVEARGEWTVIVLTNFDPPTGERIGVAIADALSR
jgi:CubicO group peptidase (beta-lactamase class C family)